MKFNILFIVGIFIMTTNINLSHANSIQKKFPVGPQRTYSGNNLKNISFPIGGIGAGTIGLGGRGNLMDFEIYNRPAKGAWFPATFFALWAKEEGKEPTARILEGEIPPAVYPDADGLFMLNGVPRFKNAEFRGEYPFGFLELSDPKVPVTAELRAWNPMIPLNVHDSALPVAIFEWTFTNPTDKPVEISLASTLSNPIQAKDKNGNPKFEGQLNEYRSTNNLKGVFLSHPEAKNDNPEFGDMAIATFGDSADIDIQTRWFRGAFWDYYYIFWDDFSKDGRLTPCLDAKTSTGLGGGTAPSFREVAALAHHAVIPPHGKVTIPVMMTWYFPKKENPWQSGKDPVKILDTYVSKYFSNSWDVMNYVSDNLPELRDKTDKFHKTLFDSSLPAVVLEAASSQAATIRSQTCFMLADGSFYGWEGAGCCHGNCTHVWNYEQSLAFLYPSLERSMRRTEFLHNVRDTGNMTFRTQIPPGSELWIHNPAADGQMGAIMQVYRDWKLSGDDIFLKKLWPNVKKCLEYAWTMNKEKLEEYGKNGGRVDIESIWDPNKDGVMEGQQHNTYDMEFYGPNSMCSSLYLGALRAAEEIALHLGETNKADEYREVYESGSAILDKELYNGEYYFQKSEVIDGVHVSDNFKIAPEVTEAMEDPEEGSSKCETEETGCICKPAKTKISEKNMLKYQYDTGCLSDQLIGQWEAHVMGLGYLLDSEKVKSAANAIFKYNFRERMGDFVNLSRVYAASDDAGLLTCTWPNGGRPKLTFPYADEVWSGIEYQVAALLAYEGFITQSLTIVQAISDRHAGWNRNPYNQVECGYQYARALASWSVKLGLDGFEFDVPGGHLGFAPKVNKEDFKTFWSTGVAWGQYSQNLKKKEFILKVIEGETTLKSLSIVDLPKGKIKATVGNNKLEVKVEKDMMILDKPVTLKTGDTLEIAVK